MSFLASFPVSYFFNIKVILYYFHLYFIYSYLYFQKACFNCVFCLFFICNFY